MISLDHSNDLKKSYFQVGTENGEAVSQSKAFTQLNGNVGQGKKDQVGSIVKAH